MRLSRVMFASFMALSLVACGSGDDKAKPDDPKNKIPPKTQACIDAGDLCKLENNEWVIHKKNDGDKPGGDDVAPTVDTSFDYSDIGVTDAVVAQKKGFSFYRKGDKSPLDAKWFENGVTLSPSVAWSSQVDYDRDLYNFVALRLADDEKTKAQNEKNPIKFMFDKIGVENHKVNKNIEFFGGGKHMKTAGRKTSTVGEAGNSSISSAAAPEYWWNSVPAVVNTFMYRKSDLKWAYAYADSDNKLFNNQEEESKSQVAHPDSAKLTEEGSIGSGAQKLRVYGRNAFLSEKVPGDFLKPTTDAKGTTPATAKDTYELPTRKGAYIQHVNYVWYDQGNLSKRKKKTSLKVDDTTKTQVNFTTALDKYKLDGSERPPFPTDLSFGELKNVQFGRLTGQGVDPERDDISGYDKKNLKEYLFTQGGAATAGNDEGEDWYFARGDLPTPVAALEAYKSAGSKIAYDGQALMFGLDYKPTKPKQKKGDDSDQSTNSVKPAAPEATVSHMLLDGKHNLLRMEWDPSTGEISGKVFGVWTKAKYWRKFDKNTKTEKIYELSAKKTVDLADTAEASKAVAKFNQGPTDTLLSKIGATLELTDATKAQDVAKNALELEPYIVPLVVMKGSVLEGSNSFGGKAVRVKDGDKGLFAGAFFGPKALEIGGVINSQTGSMKNKKLVDPGSKWGGSFGAKYNPEAAEEDLIFIDREYDYLTSTEFWND